MSNETYRMSLIALATIDLSRLIYNTKQEIELHRDKKVETKHSDTEQYLFHTRELKRLKKLIMIQKDELRSRQMKMF